MVGGRKFDLLGHVRHHPVQQLELGSLVSQQVEEDRTLTDAAKIHRLALHPIEDGFGMESGLNQGQTAKQP